MKKNLYIYCSGGAGKEMADRVMKIQKMNGGGYWNGIYFIDDVRTESEYYGLKILSYEKFKNTVGRDRAEIIIATGEPVNRKNLYEKVEKDGFDLATIISPLAMVSPTARIGKGVIISEFCIIASDTLIEDNVFINYNCIIGHDCKIGKNTCLSERVSLGGNVIIEENCYLAIGTSVINKAKIKEWSITAINSAVIKDVPENSIVGGIPAKMVKYNDSKKVFK